jgi:hypothetical protein
MPELKPESIGAMFVTAAKDAPAGTHRTELRVEVTNFHTAPGRNLAAAIPLEIEVAP